MCGIFGYSLKPGAFSEGRRAILAAKLAELNDDRGGHSWGFVELDARAKTPRIERGLGEFAPHVSRMIGAIDLFGHTRWATCGEKTVANAHPFEVGSIVGAHNGRIWNHEELQKKHGRKFEVDSMHLFAHLHFGMKFDEIQGYGSIEWIDLNDRDGINLCRMRDGELAIYGLGTHKDTRGIVWSSDKDHAQDALRKAGFTKFFRFQIDDGKVYCARGGDLFIKEGVELNLSLDAPAKKPSSILVFPREAWEKDDDADWLYYGRRGPRFVEERWDEWDDESLEYAADHGNEAAMKELLRRWQEDENECQIHSEAHEGDSSWSCQTPSQSVTVITNKQ